jgi:hypothetical protein
MVFKDVLQDSVKARERLAEPLRQSRESIGLGQRILVGLVILILAWGMVYYYYGVLIPIWTSPFERSNAAGGIWSDLYPRWVGTRELLRHHRNPYSAEVTAEIQRGFYGRQLNPSEDPSNPDHEIDREEFAYPVYVTFLLAPSLFFSFHTVGSVFTVVLLLITPASLWLWMWALKLRLRPLQVIVAMIAMMSSYPVIDGLRLQQLTLLVVALMAGAMAALAGGRYLLSGGLLGLAMIKPQLPILMVVLVMVWVLGDWRSRKFVAVAFGTVVAVFLIGAEIVLPGWVGLWRQAVNAYIAHHKQPLLVAIFHPRTATVIATTALIALLALFWHVRKNLPGSRPFNYAVVAALTLTLLILPNSGGYYNHVLLLPAALWMFFSGLQARGASALVRLTWLLSVIALIGQWIAALPLSLGVLFLHWHFERESTLIVAGPEILVYFFPILLGVFVLSAGPWAARRA